MYKIIWTEDGEPKLCDHCDSQVPLDEFGDDRKIVHLCEFCANATGPKDEPITRVQLAQMLNVLRAALEPRGEKGES